MSRFFHRHQKTIIWIVVLSFFIGSVVLVGLNQAGIFQSSPTTDQDDRPEYAVRVNDEKIDVAALNAVANQIFNQYQRIYQQIGQDASVLLEGARGAYFLLGLQADAANEIIRRALYRQEAQARGVRVSDSQVEATLEEQYTSFLRSNNVTEEQLIDYLEQQGSSLTAFRESIRAEIEVELLQVAVNESVAGLIAPTEDELMAYYEAHIAEYDVGEKVRASHVLTEDLETAQEVKALLDDGADFAELASIYSIDTNTKESGGDLDWFGRGETVSEFEEAVFALRVGEISEPVQTEYGYHIIKLTDREAAHTPTFDEVRDDVYEDYAAEETEHRVEERFRELRAASQIEVAFPLINAYLLKEEGIDLALAEFERIRDEGLASDPYLPYYIGRLYEEKAQRVASELTELEAIEEPTEADLARIEALQAEQDANEAAALASYLAALENVDADETFLNRILSLNPDSTDATFLLGKLFYDRGDYVKAEERFAAVIAKDDEYVAAYVASGDLAVRTGNYPLARSRYEKALQLRESSSSVMLKLVNVHLELGAIDEAQGLIDEVQAIDPENVSARIAEGDVARAQLATAVAERDELEAKESLTEEEAARLAELGEAIEEHYEIAVARYERAIQSGGSLELRTKLGDAHLLAGRLDEAEDEFEDVIMRSPYTADAYEGLGKVLIARGEIEEGLENLRTALVRSFDTAQRERVAEQIVEMDPTDIELRMDLAEIYASQYKWSAAITQYAAVLDARPGDLEAALGIAEAYRWRGEHSTGIEYLERVKAETEGAADLIRLNEAIVEIADDDAGADKPLGAAGLDALIELAELHLADDVDAAVEALERVRTEDPAYRADEVEELLRSTEPEPEDPAGEDVTDAGSSDEDGASAEDDDSSAP